MRKGFCFLTALLLNLTLALNVFAVPANVIDPNTGGKQLTETYTIANANNSSAKMFYYYNNDTGVISSSSSKEETGLGDLIKYEEKVEDYAFTYKHSNGTTYHYSILDEFTDEDGKKQYFIYANDSYGRITQLAPEVSRNNFNPEDADGIGYFLNNNFYNGMHARTIPQFDSVIKEYIKEHEYLIEGSTLSYSGALSDYAYQQYDYKVNMKISLISVNEYAKYHKKIQTGFYHDVGSTFATTWGSRILFRSPATLINENSNGVNALRFYQNNIGDTGAENVFTGAEHFIRPCFYVSEDYFKNVKLTSAGDEVKKCIRMNFTKAELSDLYTDEELRSFFGYKQSDADVEFANIYGDASIGSVVGFDYKIKNGDENTKAAVTWYLSDSEGVFGTEVHSGDSLTLTDAMLGKYLRVKLNLYDSVSGDCFKKEVLSVGRVSDQKEIAASAVAELTVVGDKKQATFNVKNNSGDLTKKVKLFVTAFDENNVMTGISTVVETLDEQSNSFDLGIDTAIEAAYYRIMVWDDDDNSLLCGVKVKEEL